MSARLCDVSILIVNWNGRDLLSACVKSVYETVRHLVYEVIVVDNASTDGSSDMVREQFPAVQLVQNDQNLGFACANNQAIRASQGRYVLLLNSDTIVRQGALEAMVHFADRHPKAGVVGCKLLNADGSLQPSWAQFPTLWSEVTGRNFRRRYRTPEIDGEAAYLVDWVGGACLLARREAVDRVGLLDEDFWMYSEETDWCFRFVREGWLVYYLPEASIVHLGGGSSRKASERTLIQLYESKLRFFFKHRGRFQAETLRWGMILVAMLKMGVSWTIRRSDMLTRQRLLVSALQRSRYGLKGTVQVE